MKIGIIIQARLTSENFPNKVLAMFNGKTVIETIIERIKHLPFQIVVAIPNTPSNDILDKVLISKGIPVSRGKEHDVLNRFYECAKWWEFDVIIRVCADTVLIRASDIERNVKQFLDEGQNRMIYGNGSWVFNFDMLSQADAKQVFAKSREHVVRSFFMSIDYTEDINRIENGRFA